MGIEKDYDEKSDTVADGLKEICAVTEKTISLEETVETTDHVKITLPGPHQVEIIAAACHMVNKAYCQGLGDGSHVPWERAPEWQKESCRKGVIVALLGASPRESHESWLKEKTETGWKFGHIKDVDKKEHPCFVPYDELPPAQQEKDSLYIDTVRSMKLTLGL